MFRVLGCRARSPLQFLFRLPFRILNANMVKTKQGTTMETIGMGPRRRGGFHKKRRPCKLECETMPIATSGVSSVGIGSRFEVAPLLKLSVSGPVT